MAELIAQPSINDVRTQSLLVLVDRLGRLDLTPLLVYRLESAPDSALIFLAWQFDTLDPSWQLAGASAVGAESIDTLTDIDVLTDIDTLLSLSGTAGSTDFDSWRALLQIAIPLHRVRGTPSAIKQALGALGWSGVTLLEGQASWGGSAYPASQGWAVFRVQCNLAAGQTVASGDAARIAAAVNFFKPARAWLDEIVFVAEPLLDLAPAPGDFTGTIDAAAVPTDVIAPTAEPIADLYGPISPRHNRHYYYAGITYGAGEPVVADSGLTVNGTAVSAKG